MTTVSISINDNNDLYVAPSGNLAMVTDLEAVGQNCKTAMQAQLYEMIYAYDVGMPNRDTVYDNYNPVQFEAAARATLIRVADVLEVSEFTIDSENSLLVYTATIKTTYGSVNING